jgi:O-antigen/teichoic acid export membrane protein
VPVAGIRRRLPSAATGRLVPVGDGERAPVGQPPADIAPHEIQRSVKRGALWALASQIGVQALRLIGVAVLARLLTPDQYGAAALAITIGSFSMILGPFGYGTALVQASTATQRRASTAWWCAVAVGLGGSLIATLGAYPAAAALDEPDVAGLVIVGGLTLLLAALGSTSLALLTRSMKFGVIQSAGLIGAAVATVFAIVAAALGAGAWALALQQVVLAAVTALLFIIPARWRPSFQFDRADMRSLTRFAVPYTGATVFFLIQQIVTALLIGHFIGLDELGIWNFSMALVMMPLSVLAFPVARVVYAAFARMRDRQERVIEMWVNGFTMLAAITSPALFGLIAVAPDLIPLVFGSQWDPAVPVVQVLCVMVMSQALLTWNEAVMDAAGKPHVPMLLTGSVLVACLPAVWLGSEFGLVGVAVAYSAATVIFGQLPSFLLTTRELSLNALSVLARLRGIVPAGAAACLAVVFLRHVLEDQGVPVEPRLVVSIIAGAVVYLAVLSLLARDVTRQLLQMIKGLGPALRSKT